MDKAFSLLQSNGHPMLHSNPRLKPTCSSFSRNSILVRACSSKNNHEPCYYQESINGHIKAYLNEAIPIRPPLSVFEPLHHLTCTAPWSNAPALCIAACELVGGSQDRTVIAAAAAIHLVHASSFIHEQLQLKDGPTNQYNIKLLTGDGMIPFGLELLANSDDPAQNNSEYILRVIIEITRAIGSHGMIQGKYHEIILDNKIGLNENRIDYVCQKKEGALHACAAACGAILGGGNEDEIEKVRKYGHLVGTMQGIMNTSTLRSEKHYLALEEDMRKMALKELKDFSTTKVELISSFLYADSYCA